MKDKFLLIKHLEDLKFYMQGMETIDGYLKIANERIDLAFKMGQASKNKELDELRSFIVDSNLENAFLSQLNDKTLFNSFKKWLE